MKLDDAWILKNASELTPETAKFLLAHHGLGKLKLSQQSLDLLKYRVLGHVGGNVPPRPDWAKRAAGEHE